MSIDLKEKSVCANTSSSSVEESLPNLGELESVSAEPTQEDVLDHYMFPKTLLDSKKQFKMETKLVAGILGANKIDNGPESAKFIEGAFEYFLAADSCGLENKDALFFFNASDREWLKDLFNVCGKIPDKSERSRTAQAVMFFLKSTAIKFTQEDGKLYVVELCLRQPQPSKCFPFAEKYLVKYGMSNYNDLHYIFKIPAFMSDAEKSIQLMTEISSFLKLDGMEHFWEFEYFEMDDLISFRDSLRSGNPEKLNQNSILDYPSRRILKSLGVNGNRYQLNKFLRAFGKEFVVKGLKNIKAAVGSRGLLNLVEMDIQAALFKKLCLAYEGNRVEGQKTLLLINSGLGEEGQEILTLINSRIGVEGYSFSLLIENYNLVWVDNPKKAMELIKPSEVEDLLIMTKVNSDKYEPISLNKYRRLFRKIAVVKEAMKFMRTFKRKYCRQFFPFIKRIDHEKEIFVIDHAYNFAMKKMFLLYPTGEELLNIAYGLQVLGQEKMLEMYKKCGIVMFGRYSPSTLNKLYDNLDAENENLKGKPLFLKVSATTDSNGALYNDLDNVAHLKNLFENYRVVAVETALPELELPYYLEKFTEEFNGPVAVLNYDAHGSPSGSLYSNQRRGYFGSDDERLVERNDTKLFELVQRYMKRGGKIIMDSCSTGKGENSVAQVMSQVMSDVTVYAPDADTSLWLTLSNSGEIKIEYSKASVRIFTGGAVLENRDDAILSP